MKEKLLNGLETFSKAMVQPLMYLSVAGMIMVIGVVLTSSQITSALPFLQWGPIQVIGQLIYDCVMVIINNLAVIFAIGIPMVLAKKEKHHAAIIGFMAYFIYLTASHTLLEATGQLAEKSEFLGLIGTGQAEILGIQVVDMSVFGGICMGLLTGWVFNRTYTKKFSGALQIYSGTRFSFLIMFFVAILFGCVSNVVWPVCQQGISALATLIKNSGTFGLFLYGFLERLLIPTGLHHLIYTPFQFTDLGGVLQVGDTTVAGAYAIAMTEMNMDVAKFSDSIYYMAIGFTKMFGYIGIGGAFIYTSFKENRKETIAKVVPLVITACLAAITEPLDFMFIFCAPLLYLAHACIAGLFIALLKIFNVTAFCGGNLLASIIMNVSAGVEKTNYPMMFLLGAIEIVVYFVVFSFIIKKMDYATPGRERTASAVEKAAGAAVTDNKEKGKAATPVGGLNPALLIEGLGGVDNINTIENCFTRLRVNVLNPDLVNEDIINQVKNSGIVRKKNDIQIIFGLEVADVKKSVEECMEEMAAAA